MNDSQRSRPLSVVFVAAALVVCWFLRHALLLIYVSAIFAVVFSPGVEWIQRVRIRGWSPGRGLALLILATIVVGAITLFAALALPPIISDSRSLSTELPKDIHKLADRVRELPFGDRIAEYLNGSELQRLATAASATALKVFQGVTGAVTGFISLVLLTAYFILDGERAFLWVLAFFPPAERERLRRTSLRARDSMQRWLGGQAILMIILGVCSIVVLGLLHVRYFYAIGVFAGIANFVPVLGAFVTIVLAALVAAIDGLIKVIGVLIFYLVYIQIENAYLTPRILGSTVNLPGISILLALVIGSEVAGVIGAVVSVPSAALVATFAEEYGHRSKVERPGKSA